MKEFHRIRKWKLFYYGLCFMPAAFIFFMIGGAFESVSLFGYNLGSTFVNLGILFLGVILVAIILSSGLSLTLTQRELTLLKEIKFCGIPIRSRTFHNGKLYVSKEQRGVFASDTLAAHEGMCLKIASQIEPERIVVGDLERVLFGINLRTFVRSVRHEN